MSSVALAPPIMAVRGRRARLGVLAKNRDLEISCWLTGIQPYLSCLFIVDRSLFTFQFVPAIVLFRLCNLFVRASAGAGVGAQLTRSPIKNVLEKLCSILYFVLIVYVSRKNVSLAS